MKAFYFFLLILIFPFCLSAQIPATEVRAVWITTNWKLDWPKDKLGVASQKNELIRILDRLKENNFNTILFQVRAQGTVYYRSSIEPLSPNFDHSDNFDPLAFAIEESHKRGIECHAWIIVYPMQTAESYTVGKGRNKRRTVVMNKPDYYKLIGNTWYLDPGRPETRNLIVSITKEIVSKYDVDGVHYDYIRYPSNTQKFPDGDTFQRYGFGKSLHDWRRDNINQLVANIYDEVKRIKKWVQVSSSPLGRYKVLGDVSPNDSWTAYEIVFQDAGYWMRSSKHDLLFPMTYYRGRNFYPFVDDWVANSNGRIVVPGLGVYQMDEQHWGVKDIIDQIRYSRSKTQGQAYFRAGNILSNLKGIEDSIRAYYPFPAKLPPLKWLDNVSPNSPKNLEVYKDKNGVLNIKWDAPDKNENFTYTVYYSQTENINVSDAATILTTGLYKNSFSFVPAEGDFGFYYSVTASDRYHNESVPCFPTFFSHSKNKQ